MAEDPHKLPVAMVRTAWELDSDDRGLGLRGMGWMEWPHYTSRAVWPG